ncbi:MAG TPA: flagellar basal body P-ring formation chaperone FlgA [Phenylobacterium sp.]|jgi:flagella basal body P-ring formation protein FlgA|nr:flagellar basal body P-ring formation chaperone FlgA [Phenylobacterium sp.]
MRTLVLLAAAGLALAGPALAGQPVTLRADTESAGRLVTLGDLFDGAGDKARAPIASRNGTSVVLNARAVQIAAARAGLDWANAQGLKTIVVHGGPVEAEGGRAAAAARGNVEVLSYARDIGAGEQVRAEDLVWGKAAAMPADAAHDPDAIIGMTARRPLRAGAAALAHDVSAPIVIKAGEMITVSFQADGVSLSLQGKAMSAGGMGEMLNVENTASKKLIQAVVTGPGAAVVGPQAEALKAAHTTRFASR